MRICIVGPGAMGCLFYSFLAKAKEDVWLLDKSPRRAQRIQKQGIKIEGITGPLNLRANITAKSTEVGACDLVIICVKSYDTRSAMEATSPLKGEDTTFLTLQNGIGNMEIMGEFLEEEKLLGGVTSQGATLLEEGHIRHAGRGETVIGRLDGKLSSELRDIRQLFNRVGIPTKVSKDITSLLWSKLIVNVGINALTAITHLHNGKIVEFPGTKEILRSAVSEAARIAKKKRIKLTYSDPIQKVESVAQATATNISSMLQDVLRKRRTEIDFINGAVVRLGRSLGVPTPINSVLLDLVKTIEESYTLRID